VGNLSLMERFGLPEEAANRLSIKIQQVTDLEELIESTSLGDPQSPLRWTSKSLRNSAEELKNMGHNVTHSRVADMLHMLGYSLQANRKTIEGASHPDRDNSSTI
jgi:hypothetical protein